MRTGQHPHALPAGRLAGWPLGRAWMARIAIVRTLSPLERPARLLGSVFSLDAQEIMLSDGKMAVPHGYFGVSPSVSPRSMWNLGRLGFPSDRAPWIGSNGIQEVRGSIPLSSTETPSLTRWGFVVSGVGFGLVELMWNCGGWRHDPCRH